MPASRVPPARSSQRRNSVQNDTPSRTRSTRGEKPATTKPDKTEVDTKLSPSKLSPNVLRKTTRSASNISSQPSFTEAAPEIYASYENPLLMVFGLSREFFDSLKKHHGKLPKERKSLVGSVTQQSSTPEEESQSEDDSTEESDMEAPVVSQSTPRGRGRGRGSRGGRGGRGRGGRSRGRGGRGRGGLTRATSPVRSRPSRNAAPMFPLTEPDDDDPSNQASPIDNAKLSQQLNDSELMTDVSQSEDENDVAVDDAESDDGYGSENYGPSYPATPDGSPPVRTPAGSPPAGLQESILDGTFTPAPAPDPESRPASTVPRRTKAAKPALSANSVTQTSRAYATTQTERTVPKLLEPEDDVISDSDLPDPWIYDAPKPSLDECEDRADYLLQQKFDPMAEVQDIIASLTKYPTSQRRTENLYLLAENAQYILKAWQDEYLKLDARTAPHMHPPKKACNGGRIPAVEQVFEDMKEADLYGYTYDPKKLPGCQDPFAQRPGAEKSGGRELRLRRARDLLDSAAPSEEDEEEDNEGRLTKRQRKIPRKFDGTDTGTGANTPKKHSGWGGARKKGVSRFSKPTSETPEPDSRPAKRARTAVASALHQRLVHESFREGSIATTSGDENSSAMDVDEYQDVTTKRGRPPGSKNAGRRSDFGVKKGPRKKPADVNSPTPSAHGPNAPPPALQSLSAGQGQFSIDPQPSADTPPSLAPNSAETVFQAMPQPATAQDTALVHPSESKTPDAYMITAPLSQYTSNYTEDTASASGSRRKPRVKSEKRSQSMTIWWAERKARKKEQNEKNGTSVNAPPSRSNSSGGKRGGKATAVQSTASTPMSTPPEMQRPSPMHHTDQYPQDPYAMHAPPPPSAPSPHLMYAPAPLQHPMMLQYSPLAALPTGSFPGYSSAPPNSHLSTRTLAPAPQQLPTYPSPYGPTRPQSSGQVHRSGPPPLAPAPAPPQHFSPYAPMNLSRDMPFKVMVPGPPPEEDRRDNR